MKLPRNFFKPLAIGAPAPLRELPVRLERMIHFVPPHIEKIRAKVPELIAPGRRGARQPGGRDPRRRQGGGARGLHRDGAARLRPDRPVDPHQRAQLPLGARRHHADRRGGRQQARRDDAAEGRGAVGHPLPRPAAGAARGAPQGLPPDPDPRDPGDRRGRQQCRGDRGRLARACTASRSAPRTLRPRAP